VLRRSGGCPRPRAHMPPSSPDISLPMSHHGRGRTLARTFVRTGGDLTAFLYRADRSCRKLGVSTDKFKTRRLISIRSAVDCSCAAERAARHDRSICWDNDPSRPDAGRMPDRGSDWDGASAIMKRIELSDAVAQKLGDHAMPHSLHRSCSADPDCRDARALPARPVRAGTGAVATAPEFLRL